MMDAFAVLALSPRVMAAPRVPPTAMAADSSSSLPRPASRSASAAAATAAPARPPADSDAETARLEAAVDEAIGACDGDMRAAVRALIVANDYLEQELCAMFAAVSRGYARGRFGRADNVGSTAENADRLRER